MFETWLFPIQGYQLKYKPSLVFNGLDSGVGEFEARLAITDPRITECHKLGPLQALNQHVGLHVVPRGGDVGCRLFTYRKCLGR